MGGGFGVGVTVGGDGNFITRENRKVENCTSRRKYSTRGGKHKPIRSHSQILNPRHEGELIDELLRQGKRDIVASGRPVRLGMV